MPPLVHAVCVCAVFCHCVIVPLCHCAMSSVCGSLCMNSLSLSLTLASLVHVFLGRYWSHMVHLPHSRIMKRTFPITTAIMAWSALALNFNKYIPFVLPRAPLLAIPLPAITLFSSFVTLLLTYRTNQSLSRILEGRLAWGRTVLLTRDTAQLLAAYIYKADKRYGLLAARHLSLFGWLLKCRLRDEDDGDLINGMLNPVDAQYVSQQRKHPVAIITVVRQIVSKCAVEGKINYAAQMSLEGNLLELNRVYGMCERIKMSPIPPMYTRHTSRVLMFWLFSLPLALQSLMRNIPSVMLITFCASYVTLGLDEISMQLEQPFRLMPMQPLAAAVMRDVADAFVCQPPELGVEEEGEEFEKPGYWPK